MHEEVLKIIKESKTGVLLAGTAETAEAIKKYLEKDNSEAELYLAPRMGMEEAKNFRERAVLPAKEGVRYLVFFAEAILREARQALLKAYEEPGEGVKLVVVMPRPRELPATVRSRLIFINTAHSDGGEPSVKYLASSAKERLKITENIEEEEGSEAFLAFLDGIESAYESEKLLQKGEPWPAALRDILGARRALAIQGTSKKQLLEYLAITLPRLSAK